MVEAQNFREAEDRITEVYLRVQEFDVARMRRSAYGTVILTDDSDENFYVATVDVTIPAEPPLAEKHEKTKYLVQASSVDTAHANVREYLKDSLTENTTVGVMKSRVVAVIEKPKDEKPKTNGSKQ